MYASLEKSDLGAGFHLNKDLARFPGICKGLQLASRLVGGLFIPKEREDESRSGPLGRSFTLD